MDHITLRGLSTTGYRAADLAAAKAWYTKVLGVAPYFDTPAYIEFRLGDFQHEFGILDAKYVPDLGGEVVPQDGRAGAVVYWHVDDIEGTYKRLAELGATPHQPPRDFGHGFIGATVIDPFGNMLGVMYNPHYVETIKALGKA